MGNLLLIAKDKLNFNYFFIIKKKSLFLYYIKKLADMDALLILPKDKSELLFISELLKKIKVDTKILSAEQKEDLGLVQLMKKVDRNQKVSRANVMKKLSSK